MPSAISERPEATPAPFDRVIKDLFHETLLEFRVAKILGREKWIVVLSRRYLGGEREKLEYVYRSAKEAGDELPMHIEHANDPNW